MKNINFDYPELSYTYLMGQLSGLTHPRREIGKFIKHKDIIRVKKGLYVENPSKYHRPYSKEILANIIYGPSYISKEYALFYYELIPERVETISSVNFKRKKNYDTPIGRFSYDCLPLACYTIGFTSVSVDQKRQFLIASKEKALVDLLYKERDLNSIEKMYTHLTQNLRIDSQDLIDLDIKSIHTFQKVFKKNSINILIQTLKELQ